MFTKHINEIFRKINLVFTEIEEPNDNALQKYYIIKLFYKWLRVINFLKEKKIIKFNTIFSSRYFLNCN